MAPWVVAMAVTSALAVQAEVRIPDGAAMRARMRGIISSHRSVPGDPVQLVVAADVLVDGVLAIRKGTLVSGAIVEARPGRLSGRAARLVFAVGETAGVDGRPIRLRSAARTPGDRRVRVTGTRSALLLWASEGSTFNLFVDGDHVVTAPPAAPAPPRDLLTNEDVVKLVAAGIGEDVVIATIRRSRAAFRVDADGLIQLRKAGVSDAVIKAMLEAARPVRRAPRPPIK